MFLADPFLVLQPHEYLCAVSIHKCKQWSLVLWWTWAFLSLKATWGIHCRKRSRQILLTFAHHLESCHMQLWAKGGKCWRAFVPLDFNLHVLALQVSLGSTASKKHVWRSPAFLSGTFSPPSVPSLVLSLKLSFTALHPDREHPQNPVTSSNWITIKPCPFLSETNKTAAVKNKKIVTL